MLDDDAVLVGGAVEDETAGQTSAENSLALGNGRHQLSASDAHDESESPRKPETGHFAPDPLMH